MRRLIATALDIALPPRCPVTAEKVSLPGDLSPGGWAALSFITDPFCNRCGLPFAHGLEASGSEAQCVSCLDHPPSFGTGRSALVYNDTSRDLILRFKHGDQMHLVRTFLPWMQRAGENLIEQADVIVPVPLHRFRLVGRRYNQAAVLAMALAEKARKKCLPGALVRTRRTPPQAHLKYEARAQNVKNAFMMDAAYNKHIYGRRVLLVDDVHTTGSTLNACAKPLLDGGAAHVDTLCLARAVKDM